MITPERIIEDIVKEFNTTLSMKQTKQKYIPVLEDFYNKAKEEFLRNRLRKIFNSDKANKENSQAAEILKSCLYVVSEKYKVSKLDIIGELRLGPIISARHAFVNLSRYCIGPRSTTIGRYINKDHLIKELIKRLN